MRDKGKIERFFRTVRNQFLVELTDARIAGIGSAAELNRLFTAWVETVYHTRPHSETGQPPLACWESGGPFPLPSAGRLAEAFRWSEWRTVRKETALVSLHGNRYQVDPSLAGRRVELVFDPFDLTLVQVRCGGRDAGTATPHQITRHAHPKARPEQPGEPADAPRPAGIDYLALIEARHDQRVAGPVNYAALAGQQPPAAAGQPGPPGQDSLPGEHDDGDGRPRDQR